MPATAALARSPLPALDDFYLVNRAGRWSAAARQAYLIRECLVQPLFDDQFVLAARAVPLADRSSGARRQYGSPIASLLRDYTLDHGAAGGLFDVVSRPAAEKLLTCRSRPPPRLHSRRQRSGTGAKPFLSRFRPWTVSSAHPVEGKQAVGRIDE